MQDQDPSPALLLTRVDHAIRTSLSQSNMRMKELVIALEWSKNETVLGDILNWADAKIGKSAADSEVNFFSSPSMHKFALLRFTYHFPLMKKTGRIECSVRGFGSNTGSEDIWINACFRKTYSGTYRAGVELQLQAR